MFNMLNTKITQTKFSLHLFICLLMQIKSYKEENHSCQECQILKWPICFKCCVCPDHPGEVCGKGI